MQDAVFKQTAEAKDNPAAAGLPSRQRGEGVGKPAPNRRGSADSFRMLAAKLGKMPELATEPAAFEVPDVQPEFRPSPPPARQDAPLRALAPQTAELQYPQALDVMFDSPPPPAPDFTLPAFQPLEPPSGFDSAPVEEAPVAEAVAESLAPADFALPPFQPLGPAGETQFTPVADFDAEEAQIAEPPPVAAADLPVTRVTEDLRAFIATPESAQEEMLEAEPEPVFGIHPEPVVAPVEAEGPLAEQSLAALLQQPLPVVETAALPEQSVSIRPAEIAYAAAAPVETRPATADPFKVTQPFADRVVDTILKNVLRDVFAKPSDDDRMAYLAEVAALLEEEERATAAAETEQATQPEQAAASEATQPTWPLQQASFGSVRPPEPPADELALPAELPLEPPLQPAAKPKRGKLPKKEAKSRDEFAEPVKTDAALETRQVPVGQADEEAAELARSLLDMMSSGGSAQPQERALAADTLLRLTPRIPIKTLVSVVERLAVMENPPQLLVAKMIRDPRAEVAAPLLERCMHITDNDLLMAASEGDPSKLRMIARRRALSPALTDKLIANGDPSVLLTLVRNPGASLSHDAYYLLAEHAEHHHGLLAPLTTRADLPAPVAFELFWLVPPELRRFIFSRFLTDSENLNRILKITMAMQNAGAQQIEEPEAQFPDKDLVEAAFDLAIEGKLKEAAGRLAEIGGICKENAERILSDADGEPIAVLFKALGYPRGRVSVTIGRLKQPDCGLLRNDRPIDELQSIFDTLSFNKARILLTYWDWFAQKSGPYAPRT